MSKHDNLSVNEHFDKLIEPLIPSKFYVDHGFDAAAVLNVNFSTVESTRANLLPLSSFNIHYSL